MVLPRMTYDGAVHMGAMWDSAFGLRTVQLWKLIIETVTFRATDKPPFPLSYSGLDIAAIAFNKALVFCPLM